MDEFSLIRQYFAGMTEPRSDVVLGIGDDCALLQPPSGEELAMTTDTLVAGRHFPEGTSAYDIGWKSLAVNLSDLAAMGAQPRWFLLALTLPEATPSWLADLAAGLRDLARQHGMALVGGDTTRGPLSITITATGSVPTGQALRRDRARPEDLVCVTGTLGDAALALRSPHADPALSDRLNRPTPRVNAGLALRGLAHAAIDLSDGLAGDLGHILEASGVGAEIFADELPASSAFQQFVPPEQRLTLQAAGGDDYELCVCLPESALADARARLEVSLTVIGQISARKGLRILDAGDQELAVSLTGYRHFG